MASQASRVRPPLVTIHRVVAPGDRGDAPGAMPIHDRFERGDRAHAARRRRVPAVGDRVDEHASDLAPRGHLDERVEMPLVAVDTAVGDEPDEVQCPIAGDSIHGGREHRAGEQLAVAYGLIDAGEILVDDAPGPHVHVADFGVAHLSGRQADGLARRNQPGVRIPGEEPVEDRRARERDGLCSRSGRMPQPSRTMRTSAAWPDRRSRAPQLGDRPAGEPRSRSQLTSMRRSWLRDAVVGWPTGLDLPAPVATARSAIVVPGPADRWEMMLA